MRLVTHECANLHAIFLSPQSHRGRRACRSTGRLPSSRERPARRRCQEPRGLSRHPSPQAGATDGGQRDTARGGHRARLADFRRRHADRELLFFQVGNRFPRAPPPLPSRAILPRRRPRTARSGPTPLSCEASERPGAGTGSAIRYPPRAWNDRQRPPTRVTDVPGRANPCHRSGLSPRRRRGPTVHSLDGASQEPGRG